MTSRPRMLTALVLAAAALAVGCGDEIDQINDEIDRRQEQVDKARDVLTNPVDAARDEADRALEDAISPEDQPDR